MSKDILGVNVFGSTIDNKKDIAVKCLECEGTGIWNYVDYISAEDCVCCKGTGNILVNI